MTPDPTPDRDALAARHGADVVDLVASWAAAGDVTDAGSEVLNDPWHTAVHEAGHAVVGRVLGLDMGQASAAPDGDSAGHSIVEDPWATLDRWWREWLHHREFRSVLRARVLMLMAGAEAECAILGGLQDVDGEHGDEGDRREVDRIVSDHPGVADGTLSLACLRRAAGRLVRRHRSTIEAVAAELRDRGTLSGPELDALAPRPKPREPRPEWVALVEEVPDGEVVSLSTLVKPEG